MYFEFTSSNRIIFGEGSLSKISEVAPELGHKALIVTGKGSVPIEPLLSYLETAGLVCEVFRVGKEPDIPIIQAGLAQAKVIECDLVIGFGGGSSLDTAKAIAAMLTNPGNLLDYLEVIGRGMKIPNMPVSMVAIPTTAGTGTEVTRNAVIYAPENHVKVSMRSPKMVPMVALVDPELTYTMSPSVTANTGLDALTQNIEAYVTRRANPMTDIVSREGIIRGARSLLKAFRDGQNKGARRDMSLTSLFSGIALGNAGLGAVHGFAGPIGGMFDAPHGAICASLLPHVMEFNVKALQKNPDGEAILGRFHEIAHWLTGDENAAAEDGVAWIAELAKALEIPGMHAFGIEKEDFPKIIGKAAVSSSMKGNPVEFDEAALTAILNEAY
jgi:alcohol dehydrogenase class IV